MLPAARQVRPDRLRTLTSIALLLAALGLVAGSFSQHWLSSDEVLHTRVGLRSIEACTDQWWGIPGDPTPSCDEPHAVPLTTTGLPATWTALGRITFALGLAAAMLLALLSGAVARRAVRRSLVLGALLFVVAAIASAYAFALLAPTTSLGVDRGCVVFLGGALLGAVAAIAARDR